MNRDMGASIALSFVVVAIAAVALYQPDPPPAKASQTIEVTATPPEPPVGAPPPPTPTSVRRDRSSGPSPGEIAQAGAADGGLSPARPIPERTPDRPGDDLPAPQPPPRTVSRRQPIATPRSPFTTANPGESLSDVAERVYGSPEAARTLWLANRDQLASPDAPLRPGTLLRTP
jgi:nucleoid-associated protein YgaU